MNSLYEKRKYIIALCILFSSAFCGIIIFNIQQENTKLDVHSFYLLVFFWFAAMASMYLYFLVNTLHGKSKDKSTIMKILFMAYPTFFLIISSYSIINMIGRMIAE